MSLNIIFESYCSCTNFWSMTISIGEAPSSVEFKSYSPNLARYLKVVGNARTRLEEPEYFFPYKLLFMQWAVVRMCFWVISDPAQLNATVEVALVYPNAAIHGYWPLIINPFGYVKKIKERKDSF